MINLLYISVAVIAIAFFVLVIYLSKTLKSLQATLHSVTLTIDSMEKQLKDVTDETAQLLHRTNELTSDIQEKLGAFTSIVIAAKETGETIQEFNQSIKKVSTTVSNQIEEKQEKITQVVQWGSTFYEIWDKWKKKRKHESVVENNTK